jgi:hypothetical protein
MRASTITVSTAEIRSDPAQPSRFEKKKNIGAPAMAYIPASSVLGRLTKPLASTTPEVARIIPIQAAGFGILFNIRFNFAITGVKSDAALPLPHLERELERREPNG